MKFIISSAFTLSTVPKENSKSIKKYYSIQYVDIYTYILGVDYIKYEFFHIGIPLNVSTCAVRSKQIVILGNLVEQNKTNMKYTDECIFRNAYKLIR